MKQASTKKSKLKKIIFILLALLVVFFIIFKIFLHNKAVDKKYITAIAKRGNIELSVLADGVVKPQNLVAIGAQTSGKITAINVVPGTKVNKEQTIATIEAVNQENNLNKAEYALAIYKSKLAQQKVQLALSEEKLARSRKLLSSNAIMVSTYKDDRAQVEINKALINELQSQISQAQIDVKTAKLSLSYTQIKAPTDGTILATLVQAGQNINAIQSVPIVAILGNLQRMKIYAQISEADISKVKIGQPVYFNVVGNPNKIYHAYLEAIDPAPESIRDDITFNPSARTGNSSAIYYNATFSIDNSDNSLRTYMNCEVHIILGTASDAILVPSSALKNINGDVARIDIKSGDTIFSRRVKIGLNNKVMAQILSGVHIGEQVVLSSGNSSSVKP